MIEQGPRQIIPPDQLSRQPFGREPFVPTSIPTLVIRQGYKDLSKITTSYPQTANGRLRYLITGGWAVRLLVEANGGTPRTDQKDLDLIVTTDNTYAVPDGCDGWYRDRYVDVFEINRQVLVNEHSVRIVPRRLLGLLEKSPIYITGPEFLIISKLYGFGKAPRPTDIADIQAILSSCKVDQKRLASAVRLLDVLTLARYSTNPGDFWGMLGQNLLVENRLPEIPTRIAQLQGQGLTDRQLLEKLSAIAQFR